MLAGTAGWYAYRTDVESSQWPAVAARLSDGRVHTSYDGWHGRARALHHVECTFQYDVDAHSYWLRSNVGDMLSIVQGQIALTRRTVTLASLEAWVKQHPTVRWRKFTTIQGTRIASRSSEWKTRSSGRRRPATCKVRSCSRPSGLRYYFRARR